MKILPAMTSGMGNLKQGQPGITGLETAIVLIAFVVVSSVFAVAALSTGMFPGDIAKETIHTGLSEAWSTLELRGAIIAKDTNSDGDIYKVYFQLANSAGGEAVDLTQGKTIIRYGDPTQLAMFDTSALFAVTPVGDADSDNPIEAGELFGISLLNMETDLTTNLANIKTFTIEVLPPKVAILYIERTTPVEGAK